MPLSAKNRLRFRQLGKFGAVGAANTFLDFFIFNFASKFLGFPLLLANTVSTTIAMVFSFVVNRKVVFKKGDGSAALQAVTFYAVTAFGLYVIQNGIIHILTTMWTAPLIAMTHTLRQLGLHAFTDAFYINNGAKAVGTVASLAWNFVTYKKVVFR